LVAVVKSNVAAAAQNIRRLVRFLSQTQQPGMMVTTQEEGSLRTRAHAVHGQAEDLSQLFLFQQPQAIALIEGF
jgi:hypothetical protein